MSKTRDFQLVLDKTMVLVQAADAEDRVLRARYRGMEGAPWVRAPSPMRDALTNFFYQRSEADLAKLEALVQVGRGDAESVRTVVCSPARDSRCRDAVVARLSILPLGRYLELGIDAARRQGVELEEDWGSAPESPPPNPRSSTPVARRDPQSGPPSDLGGDRESRPGVHIIGRMRLRKPTT